jgi:hypothetical protein
MALKSLVNEVAAIEALDPVLPLLADVVVAPVEPLALLVVALEALPDEGDEWLDEPQAATPRLAATARAAKPALPLMNCTDTSYGSSPRCPPTGTALNPDPTARAVNEALIWALGS